VTGGNSEVEAAKVGRLVASSSLVKG